MSEPVGLARLSVAGCAPFVALVHGSSAQALADWDARHGQRLVGVTSMSELLETWDHNAPVLASAWPEPERGVPLSQCQVHAPVQPRSVFCTIGNYRAQLLEVLLDQDAAAGRAPDAVRRDEHLAAIARRADGEPYIVGKPAASVAGPFDTLALGEAQATLDWEVELAAVIGRDAWQVDATNALTHVAGWCTANDITLRERLYRAAPAGMGTDFLQAKGGPGWLPLGPCLVPAVLVPDPCELRLQLSLNGQPLQHGAVDDMVFGVAEQIAYLSRHVRLLSGDVVCTGSPAGFGVHHGRYLQRGDVVEAEVIGLGRQRTVIA